MRISDWSSDVCSSDLTQTQRMLQWREKAVNPSGDARSELWFFYHLGRMIKERLADSTDERDRPVLDLEWDYPLHNERNAERSDERRVGQECGSTGRTRGSP